MFIPWQSHYLLQQGFFVVVVPVLFCFGFASRTQRETTVLQTKFTCIDFFLSHPLYSASIVHPAQPIIHRLQGPE